jgi:hypothetical protein
MAIVSVDHVWSGETWSDDVTGPRGYEALYRVISNDPAESPQNVRAASGLPALGAAFATDASAFARRRRARRLDASRLVWEVTVTYEFGIEQPPESPLDEPVKIRWTSSLERIPAIKDLDGEAIVNSAGDYFDPPPEKDAVGWTIVIQYNAATVPTGILGFAGAVNNAGITVDGISIATERCRVVGLDISEIQERNDIEYRTVTLSLYALDPDEDGFDLSLLDQGFRIKDGTDLKDILIEDEDGNENRPSSPVLLDGSGAKLSDPSPSTAVFMDYEVTRKKDLSAFPGIT